MHELGTGSTAITRSPLVCWQHEQLGLGRARLVASSHEAGPDGGELGSQPAQASSLMRGWQHLPCQTLVGGRGMITLTRFMIMVIRWQRNL